MRNVPVHDRLKQTISGHHQFDRLMLYIGGLVDQLGYTSWYRSLNRCDPKTHTSLVVADNDALSSGNISQKYYVPALFTRHIYPGMTILDGGSNNTVAAYDVANQKLIIVAVNWGDAQYPNFNLSSFSTPGTNGALVPRWRTQIGSGDQYVSYHDTYISGTKFWSYFVTN